VTDENGELELCIKKGSAVEDCCSGVCFLNGKGLTGEIPTEIGQLEKLTWL
jgi:hypothetical protein